MRSRSWRGTAAAFVAGVALGVPLLAWSGGDVCAPFHESHWDEADLVLTSWTIDGVAQPLPPSTTGTLRSWTPDGSGTDDRDAYLTVPDAGDASKSWQLYLVRQP